MPDQVRAKLHKVTGLVLRDAGEPAAALEHLRRAMQLDAQAGVKKEIERLDRELQPKPARPAAKPAAPRKKTTRSATPQNAGVRGKRRLTECATRQGGTPVNAGFTRSATGVHRPP